MRGQHWRDDIDSILPSPAPTSAPTPSPWVVDADNNGVAVTSCTVTVNAYVGTVTPPGAICQDITVLGSDLPADADFSIDARVRSNTDAAGNVGVGNDTETYTDRRDGTGADVITLTVTDITADDIINIAESGGNVAITGTVGGDAVNGDHRHPDRQRQWPTWARWPRALSASTCCGVADLVADADFTIDASVSNTDAAGNVGVGNDTETVHRRGRDRTGAD